MTASTTEFHVHGANALDDEGGERFQVKVQQLGAPLIAGFGANAVATPQMVGAIVPLDFALADADALRGAGVKRGARVTLSLAVVPEKA